jgi:hypothetical protein
VVSCRLSSGNAQEACLRLVRGLGRPANLNLRPRGTANRKLTNYRRTLTAAVLGPNLLSFDWFECAGFHERGGPAPRAACWAGVSVSFTVAAGRRQASKKAGVILFVAAALLYSDNEVSDSESLMLKFMIVLVLLGATSSMAGSKRRAWQTGTLLDAERNQYFVGLDDSPGKIGNYEYPRGPATATYRVYPTYVIETEKYVYVVEERLRWQRSKPARLIVNAPVRFAIEKDKLYLLGGAGKEHETRIVKQIQKPAK